jgi:8-oxo-dGTP diphosphatase
LLRETLADYFVDRIVSSPLRRCIETVEPIARLRGVEIESCDELAPDASIEETRALLRALPETSLVCTHREVIQRLFDGAVECEKAGTWILARRRGRFVPTAYLAPPSSSSRLAAARAASVR